MADEDNITWTSLKQVAQHLIDGHRAPEGWIDWKSLNDELQRIGKVAAMGGETPGDVASHYREAIRRIIADAQVKSPVLAISPRALETLAGDGNAAHELQAIAERAAQFCQDAGASAGAREGLLAVANEMAIESPSLQQSGLQGRIPFVLKPEHGRH